MIPFQCYEQDNANESGENFCRVRVPISIAPFELLQVHAVLLCSPLTHVVCDLRCVDGYLTAKLFNSSRPRVVFDGHLKDFPCSCSNEQLGFEVVNEMRCLPLPNVLLHLTVQYLDIRILLLPTHTC